MGRQLCPRTGHTGLGGTASPAQGVGGVSFRAHGEAASSKNRAHRLGGTGSPAQGVVGVSFRAHGKAASSKNRAHRPGGDGEPIQGGGWSILQGPWEGGIVQEPGTPAWGGRGAQLRGWSEYPSGPMGRQLCPRTGHTGLGGMGSPAQGVVGGSFRAHGEASSSKNRAHRGRGDGESCPGVVGVSFRAHGEAASSKNRAHRPGGTGCPAQGMVGVSFRAHGESGSRLGGLGGRAQGEGGVLCRAGGEAVVSLV